MVKSQVRREEMDAAQIAQLFVVPAALQDEAVSDFLAVRTVSRCGFSSPVVLMETMDCLRFGAVVP